MSHTVLTMYESKLVCLLYKKGTRDEEIRIFLGKNNVSMSLTAHVTWNDNLSTCTCHWITHLPTICKAALKAHLQVVVNKKLYHFVPTWYCVVKVVSVRYAFCLSQFIPIDAYKLNLTMHVGLVIKNILTKYCILYTTFSVFSCWFL